MGKWDFLTSKVHFLRLIYVIRPLALCMVCIQERFLIKSGFFSSCSLKMREKCISFAQLVASTNTCYYSENQVFGGVTNRDMSLNETCYYSKIQKKYLDIEIAVSNMGSFFLHNTFSNQIFSWQVWQPLSFFSFKAKVIKVS